MGGGITRRAVGWPAEKAKKPSKRKTKLLKVKKSKPKPKK
jgi:hypothetical protein